MNKEILDVFNAAADLVYQNSHNNCGAYAVDPKTSCCATCALEAALRKAHPEYGKQQKLRAAAPSGHNPTDYGKVILGR